MSWKIPQTGSPMVVRSRKRKSKNKPRTKVVEPNEDKLKNMPYKEFLKTQYWYKIADKVRKYRHNVCAMCSKKADKYEYFEVHHLNYENHGREHIHWATDLTLLCHQCHSKIHSQGCSTDNGKAAIQA